MKYLVWLKDQQQGPFDEATIREMLLEGEIARDTLVCPEGSDLDWTSVGELFFHDSKLKSLGLAEIPDDVVLQGQADDGFRLEIRMNSGMDLIVKAVRLYDESGLVKLNSKKAEARKMFQGVSTGLGAIGSIEWVLAASVIIGATEAALSSGAASAGVRLLEEAIYLERKIRNEGVFSPVGTIRQIEDPIPNLWRVSKKDLQGALIHNGDEFISMINDDGSSCSIRWGAIERYVYKKICRE